MLKKGGGSDSTFKITEMLSLLGLGNAEFRGGVA
jgi:hypothetical protein